MSGRRTPTTPRWWFEGDAPPLWARLLAPVYGILVASRRFGYRKGLLKRTHPGVPVIVVGNLVAGGSGKTPLSIALVEYLQRAGFTPGVASRGYGRADEKTPRWVDARSEPALVGDEPLLIALRTGAKVRVDVDRVAAAQALAAAGCDVVVCDDGLQHYRLARDVEIEVQDVRRRYGNGRLLPAGPLREPLERAADCAFRVLNLGQPEGTEVVDPTMAAGCATGAGREWPMWLEVGEVRPLVGGRGVPLSAFAGQRVHAVAGIGEPDRFFTMLRGLGIGVVPHAFADHHAYVQDDFDFGSPLPVLMTEKDAEKCRAIARPDWYAVPVSARLPDAFKDALLARLPERG